MPTSNCIDLVITWLDGNDPQWLKTRQKFEKGHSFHTCHYRDWDLLKYWFRCVEQNLPWIRKIHLVTFGHIPAWLDSNHPKLHIVVHDQYIPDIFLPTFSSHTIELFLHQIPELSEQFIYSNDDMFFTVPLRPDDFFCCGLPCDCPEICPVTDSYTDPFAHIIYNNLFLINRNFDFHQCVETHREKWFNPDFPPAISDGIQRMLMWKNIPGFRDPHMPLALLKSTFEAVWAANYAALYRTCMNKFRKPTDVNPFLFRYWQLMEGNFYPHYEPAVKYVKISSPDDEIADALLPGKYKMVCINDSSEAFDFNAKYQLIHQLFHSLYPQRSSFEKDK